MILRRLTEHVKAQNWFAVVIDFVIVVVGVFVGLQVSNWNAARLESMQSVVFTERLRGDLREEAWNYSYHVEYSGDVLANANRAIAALDGGAPLSDEALLISAYRATQFRTRRGRRSTFDELTSTGDIGLIRDGPMRDTAIRVYSTPLFDRIYAQGLGSKYREVFRMTIPNDVQRALRTHCGDRQVRSGDYEGIVKSLDYPCILDGLDGASIAEAAAALRANSAMVPALRLRIADLETQRGDLTQNNKDILDGLRAVAEASP